MKDFFVELFEYSHTYNTAVIDMVLTHGTKTPDKCLKLLNHTISAHHIWNHRILGKPQLFGVWDMHETSTLKKLDKQNYVNTLQILNSVDLTDVINYTNSQGQAFSNTVKDILFHVINHGTYHRGQIASQFKQHGIEPLISDYIFYKRK
ncbi:MAG TPA: DinB family protein [Bacteroidia bacterium]|nr:DinB family protein [Bacteroidia bacterium]